MKYLYILVLVILGFNAMAQEPPYTPMRNNYLFRGVRIDSLFLIPHFSDTTTANVNLNSINGNLIRIDSLVYMRWNGAWISLAGGGGSQSLQDVTDVGNSTTNNISLLNSGIILDNSSRLQKGTIDAGYGGNNGIALICGLGYEMKWEAGRLYIMNGNGNAIRETRYNFTDTPTVADDITKGYYSGSRWILDNGTIYTCSDNTTNNAVWSITKDAYVDSIYRTPGVDSFYYTKQGNTYSVKDSVGFTDTTSLSNRINLKLSISDTSGMLSTYLRIVDTANHWVNNITRTLGKDSIIYYIGSTRYAIKDSVGTNPAPVGYYGAFQDTINQTAAVINTGYPMKLRLTDLSNQVTIVSESRVTIANTGIYNIQWSAQFTNPTSAEHDVTIWLRKNGVNVAGSSGIVLVPAKHGTFDGHTLPSWNFLLDAVAGDYYEFVWSTVNTSVYISYNAAGNPPPSTASVVLTVTQQSGIMAGTGITAINSLTGAAQTMVTGTDSSDFKIVSSGTTHKFNLPTASATKRGVLSSSDWTTFNNKVNISDTSTMLSNYLRKNDTASLSNRINLKLNATDTASLSTRINAKQNTLTNPVTGTGTTGAIAKFTGTSTIGDASVDVDYLQQDMSMVTYQAMGSSIKGYLVGAPNPASLVQNFAMGSGTARWTAVYIPKAVTITGVRFYQTVQGGYTANNYNGFGLYSYSGGTLTRVDTTTNDGNLWKGTSQSWQSKAFTNTYSAAAGIYYVVGVWSSSATTTSPSVGGAGTAAGAFTNYSSFDFTNSAKFCGTTTLVTALPSTQAASGVATSSSIFGFYLY